jgi:hypothetical protein
MKAATMKRAGRAKAKPVARRRGAAKAEKGSLWALMEPYVGMAEGLPGDLAVNHDHYLYGSPKRVAR